VIWLYCEKAIKNNIVYGSNWKFCFFLKQLFKNVNVTKIPTNEDLSSYKINVSSIFKKKINLMQKFLNENYTNSLSWCKHNNLLEINNANIDKSTSINIVKKILNINSKDIASIGDSINDYDMFRNSQKKFAMKKLAKKNKQFRYTRIKSRKNGVAEAIKKYF
jgi:hydroxymethylpyrimidine pyrophosphatase-like HAD family hydrolase